MKKRTFRKQLILSYLLVTVILLGLLFSILLCANVVSTRRSIGDRLESSVQLVSSQFGFVVRNMSFISMYTLSNSEFMQAVSQLNRGAELTASKELSAYETIQDSLINYSIVSSIYHVTMFNKAGYLVTSDNYNNAYTVKSRISSEEWASLPWINRLQDNFGQAVLLPIQKRPFHDEHQDTLMMVRSIRNPGNIVGYLIVETTVEDISDTLYYDCGYDSTLMILDAQEQVIFQNGSVSDAALSTAGKTDEATWKELGYIAAVEANEELGLSFLVLTPKDTLWQEVSTQLATLLLESLLVLGVALVVIILISKKISRPLRAVSEEMQKTDLSSPRQLRQTGDVQYEEIEALYTAYNDMQVRLHGLMEREIGWKTQQTEQRLKTLQAQINPHFMYNTLNMIGIMGLNSNNRKVFEACKDFSNLLRYSISDKNSRISTVGEEIKNVRSYLGLMQLRLERACVYEIEEMPEASGQPLPRLVLQPFVENIFEHAYNGQAEVVHIRISARKDGEFWRIIITDDGCGMQQEKLDALNREIREYIAGNHSDVHDQIGVVNTLSRLSLFYNGAFDYSIENLHPGLKICLKGKWKERVPE